MRFVGRRLVFGLPVLAAIFALECATPTALTVTIYSEVACTKGSAAALVGGTSLGELGEKAPSSVSTRCDADGKMGSVVVVPAGAKDETVAFAVMQRIDGQPADGCLQQPTGCIVAKRQLRFEKHSASAMRVDLRLACQGVLCSPEQTCVKGRCVDARTACVGACDEGALVGADAGVPEAGDGSTLDAGGADANDGGMGHVVSATQLVVSAVNTFVDLAVDWTRSVAYVATREPGRCFQAIDFAGTPRLIASFGPPATGGQSCLGVSLDSSGTMLLVASEAGSLVEQWNLGADPRLGSYTRASSVAVTSARRINRDLTVPTRLYAARGKAAPGFQVVNALPAGLVLGPTFDSTLACPDNGNEVVHLATGVVLSGCSTDGSPLEVVDDQTMALLGTIPATPIVPGVSGFWSTARTADGKIGVALGWVSVVVDARGPGRYAVLARFDNDETYRGATMIDRGAGPEVVALRSGGTLDVISLANPADPVVIASGPLGVGTEGYSVKVSPNNRDAIAITNHGWFVVLDLTRLPPASFRWPAF